MRERETAIDLVKKFTEPTKAWNPIIDSWENDLDSAKDCAIIAVELRIEAYSCPPVGSIEWAEKKEEWWKKVKQEIINLKIK